MENTFSPPLQILTADNENDICVLSHIFALSEFHYLEISLKEQLPHILSRWPLLAEFAYSESLKESSPAIDADQRKE